MRVKEELLRKTIALVLLVFGLLMLQIWGVTLGWSPPTSPPDTVAGYNLYYGGSSRHYTNYIDAGPAVIASVHGIEPGGHYYFAVTAYNRLAIESDPSEEVSWTAPFGRLDVQQAVTPLGPWLTMMSMQSAYPWSSTRFVISYNPIRVRLDEYGTNGFIRSIPIPSVTNLFLRAVSY